MSDIAGSMVSAPVSLALIMAMIGSVHWRGAGAEKASFQAADSDDDEIIGPAMFAFGMLSRPAPIKKNVCRIANSRDAEEENQILNLCVWPLDSGFWPGLWPVAEVLFWPLAGLDSYFTACGRGLPVGLRTVCWPRVEKQAQPS